MQGAPGDVPAWGGGEGKLRHTGTGNCLLGQQVLGGSILGMSSSGLSTRTHQGGKYPHLQRGHQQ